MTPEVTEALEKSIVHWEDNLRHAQSARFDLVSTGAKDCALCQMFNNLTVRSRACEGCPVDDKTGEPACGATPYELVYVAKRSRDQPALVTACIAEIEFLKSLREP